MHISINTAEEISDLDRQVLGLLAGGSFVLGGQGETFTDEVYAGTDENGEDVYESEPEEEPEPEPEPEPKPAKKTTTKKAAAKKTAKKPEPEPMAEEPVDEDAGEEVDGDDIDEMEDEDLLSLAVKKATELVGSGDAAKVREALDAAGASRVRELNADNVREFFRALS